MLWGQEEKGERERPFQTILLTLRVDYSIVRLCLDLSENVIRAVVQKGHTRNVVENTLEQLCNSGYKIQNLEHAVKRVLEEIEKQAELSIKVNNQDSAEKCEKEREQHKQEVRDRLLKVVSISSAVDVLNGLRKWVTIVPTTDVSLLLTCLFLARLSI